MIKLYALNVKENYDFIKSESAAAIVSKERLEWSRKFRNESDFLLSMGGELLARALIREKLGIENEDINFSKTPYGKPFLASRENFHFNVSHSGNIVLCALADNEIGCDCEFISTDNKIEDIKIVYTDNEYKTIRSLHGGDKILFCHKIWALKESYLKCAGIGLSEEPAAIEVSFNGDGGSPSVYKNGRRLDFLLKLYDDIEGYAAALCIKKSSQKHAAAPEILPAKISFAGLDLLINT
jgi:4'-phosphopantetheinyl transferase